MKILALDSTETTATVALTEDATLLAQTVLAFGHTHSETLLPALSLLMKQGGLSYDDVDLFACSSGPGSFTGVRIGVATVKGLAFGKNKPCIGVSACEALAYNLIGIDGILCPVMDARRDQLYNALFRSENGKITRLTPDRVIAASDLSSELAAYPTAPIYFLGGGYDVARRACALPNVVDTPPLLRRQNAFSTALVAWEHYKNGEIDSAATDAALTPGYLRPSQAERNRAKG